MRLFIKKYADFSLWLLFTALATFVLFFISADSYFNDLHTRADSAWFFMCGKAWMNGLVPYVDFADSKGPLLWLIYGIGYLLNHTSYVGVYWISCLWYGLTYLFIYKTANIFLKDSRKALVCTFLMTPIFFNPWFHNEIRAEDFCLLFLVVSLYWTCRLMYGNPENGKTLRWAFFALGACFAALLLIKFNVAAMQIVFILCALYWLLREKKNLLKPFLHGLGGFVAVVLPFLVYFLFAGNFSAFIQEYFITTLQTVGEAPPNDTNILLAQVVTDNPLIIFLLEWGDLIYCPELAALLLGLMLGGILFWRSSQRYKWMPLLASVSIFVLAIRHHFMYYFNSCSFLLIFLVTGIILLFEKPLPKRVVPATAVLAASVIILFHTLVFNFKILFFNDNINQRDYYKIAHVMAQVDTPKLINAYGHECGFGLPAGTLPAGKYWAKQNGFTDGMLEEHNELILSGKADFIVIHERAFTTPGRVTEEQLTGAGYRECLRFGEGLDFILLTKREDLDIPDSIPLSHKDLFLKKSLFK